MSSSLIIIRGNSASGKTALAEACREQLGSTQTLLLSQDVIRRQILHTHDHNGPTKSSPVSEIANKN